MSGLNASKESDKTKQETTEHEENMVQGTTKTNDKESALRLKAKMHDDAVCRHPKITIVSLKDLGVVFD